MTTMNVEVISKETDITQLKTDVIVVGYFKDQDNPGGNLCFVQKEMGEEITYLMKEGLVNSSFKELRFVPSFGKFASKYIVFAGCGDNDQLSFEKMRELSAKIARELVKMKLTKITYCLNSFQEAKLDTSRLVHAITEGTILGDYRFDDYKTKKKESVNIEQLQLYTAEGEIQNDVIDRAVAFAEGTKLARDLVNIPGNLLTPTKLAERAKGIAQTYGMECTVLEKEEMEQLGMGALLAVAQGSDQPPKMIVIKYQGLSKWENVLTFVGKGLTFDSGGISIKPSANMDEMKMDMGGAAAVLGTMDVIGRLKPKCNVMAVIPSSENMPNGSALKPGDVITSLSGRTIEVKNTDAEGRLILADGITYAKQLGANYIVDIATLTGAVLVALGDCTTGAVTNNDSFMKQVLQSSEDAGELLWQLPSFQPYKEMLKTSDVADLNNSPGRLAGSITAGLFLGEFAEETPWVHLDIAGTAWSNRANDLSRKGGTGAMVRTLSTLVNHFVEQ